MVAETIRVATAADGEESNDERRSASAAVGRPDPRRAHPRRSLCRLPRAAGRGSQALAAVRVASQTNTTAIVMMPANTASVTILAIRKRKQPARAFVSPAGLSRL